MYLKLNFKVGSKVLVTSRSLEILQSLHLQECRCMEMPKLEKDDATKLFLHHVDLGSTNNFNALEWDVINGCVQACQFSRISLCGLRKDSSTQQYLPLALMVWGTQLGEIGRCPLEWKSSLENLRIHKFNHANVKIHPLFSLLRQGYDSLKPRDQFIFLDLAIFMNRALKVYRGGEFNIMKWLQHAHGFEIFSIMQSLEALKKKALLDFTMSNNILEFCIHDLYLEFAEEEIKASNSTSQASHFLYVFGRDHLSRNLQRKQECRNLKRLGIYESEVKSIKRSDLLHCSRVEVFQVFGCKNLEELDVEGMDGLQVLDVVKCNKLGQKFRGVDKLVGLEWLRLHLENSQVFLGDLSSLTALQFLELCVYGTCLFHSIDIRGCTNLQELISHNLGCPSNLCNLTRLEKLTCFDRSMESIIGLNSLTNLKVLDLGECLSLPELPGLCNLNALETLNVYATNLLEIHGIGKLQHLQELFVSEYESLTSLVELEYVTSLRRLEAQRCPSLHEFSSMMNLKKLEVVDLSDSGISVVPSGYGRLAKNRIFNLVGCVELMEPLVLWLWEQEEELASGIFMGFSNIEEIEEELWSNTRKDVAYYMEQITSEAFEELGLAGSLNALNEVHGGINFAIEALCDHEELGILSLVVAKYSADLPNAKSTYPKLSSRIIEFLNQQRNQPFNERDFDHDFGPPTFWCISFILKHVMENDLLMESFEADDICLFIKQFVNDNQHRCYCWQFGGYLDPILEQWSLYLNQCCFYEDCFCLDSDPNLSE